MGPSTIVGSGTGSTSGGPLADTWSDTIASNVVIQIGNFNPNIQGWTGTFFGTSSLNASDATNLAGCVTTNTQVFQGPLGVGKSFTMELEGNNQYVFFPSDDTNPGATSSTTNSCVPGTTSGVGSMSWSPVLGSPSNLLFHDLPAAGFSLKGSETLSMNSPEQPQSLIFGGTAAVISVTVTWDFEPGPIPAP